jgi:hypothetical protein
VSHDAGSKVGATLQGRYRLLALVAEGAMGSVYRGERLGLQRPVAVKFLRADLARDPSFVARFEAETRALGRLNHPHCVSVIDFGSDGAPYVVTDFVEGESLRAALAAGPFPPRRAVTIAQQVLTALAHAHARGIVHRDAKPENILLERAPGLTGDHVRVLDFGLSKLLDETSQVTESMMIGTPCYMAPEQFQPGLVDARADVYACGVMLYEMLTGQNPFEGGSLGDTAVAHRFMSAPPPRQLHGGRRISAALLQVLGRALAKVPAARFASAQAMKEALDGVPELAPPERKLARTGRLLHLGARALEHRLAGAATRLAARLSRWPYIQRVHRVGALALGAFAFASIVGFAVTLSARTRDSSARPAGPAVALARPAGPVPPPPVAASSEVETALALAREAFERDRYDDGVDYFRFAARRDRHVRGNAVLVDHIIDGLASDVRAPRAQRVLRELGRDARPHLQSAARTHDDPLVRRRAQALLQTQAAPKPFLRWVGTSTATSTAQVRR